MQGIMGLRRRFRGGGMDAGASSSSGDMGAGAGVSGGAQRGVRDRYNRQGTRYSDKLADAIGRANTRARERSLEARKQRAAREAIQALEAKQVSPTQSGVQSMVSRMDEERGSLRDLAKRNRITNTQLNRLGALNEAIGINRTTGMGPIESLRNTFSRPEFKQGIGNLIRNYQKISPMGLIMNKILNPQFEEETGIQSLPDFQNLQRTNQMFSPGVYDFTQPTRMPMQFAELTEDQKNFMKTPMQSLDFQSKDSLFNKIKQMEDKGIFGYGAQEPTTREEFEDYIASPEYKSAFI